MSLVDFVIWLLIPAGLLPILTAAVLLRYWRASSQALRDRSHLALALAVLGGFSALLASNRIWDWGFQGEWITVGFALVLLAVDIVSGKWLLAFWRGNFDEHRRGRAETPIEQEDREVGDTRRELQAKNRDD